MKALLDAELLKMRSTRATTLLVLATLGLAVLTVATTVPGVMEENAWISLDDPDLLAIVVGNGFGAPLVLMTLLGVLAFTQEFRYGTVTSTYLGEPRRARVLVAKGLSLVIASVVITIVTLAVTVTLSIALIRSQDGDVTVAAQFWQTVAAGFVVMAAYGVIGVADRRPGPQPDRRRRRRADLDARRRADGHPPLPGGGTLDALRRSQLADAARCVVRRPSCCLSPWVGSSCSATPP